MRARQSDGLEELFSAERGFAAVRIDDHDIDLSGAVDELWPCLSRIYELATFFPEQKDELRKAFGAGCAKHRINDDRIACSRCSNEYM